MLKIFDFKCPACGHVEERMTKDVNNVRCSKCDTLMNKQVCAPGMVQTNFADKTGFKSR